MNPLFNMLAGGAVRGQTQPGGTQTNQNQQTDFNTAMSQLRANPAQMARQAGYQIPDGMGNDPQAMVMHLIQSGQVGNPLMRMITPMLQKMMGR